MTAAPDVVIAGRICIDLYPQQSGVSLREVSSFSKSIGGSATNVAVAAARHGRKVMLLSRTGDDPFGQYAIEQLQRFGVDASRIQPVAGMQSVLTFCEMFPPDNFPLYIYRNPTAPDMFLDEHDVPLDLVRAAPVYWATATGLSREPSRTAHHKAWEARGRQGHTVLDLDHRPMFWSSLKDAARTVAAALDHVTIAIGNEEECRLAVGETEPHRAADALLERGVELAIVKQGPKGVLAKTADEVVEVPPVPVDVINGLGAGDAFGGGLIHGLLEGWGLERTLRFANVSGALVAGRFECSSAMPTTDEVWEFAREKGVTA